MVVQNNRHLIDLQDLIFVKILEIIFFFFFHLSKKDIGRNQRGKAINTLEAHNGQKNLILRQQLKQKYGNQIRKNI